MKPCYQLRRQRVALLAGALTILMSSNGADASLLYSASLKNGDYGAGYIVDTFPPGGNGSTTCFNASGIGCSTDGGNLSDIGITNTSNGVLYTLQNAVINYSMGRDYGQATMNSFRSHGTVSFRFNADLASFIAGQPFTDNYGFNQWNNGQGTNGSNFSRHVGADGQSGTADDQVQVGWGTWTPSAWVYHIPGGAVLLPFEQWNYIGFAWDDASDSWDVWVNGVLAYHDGDTRSWYSAAGLGNPYNFALGMIHQRGITPPGSPAGIMFADLNIWDEYRTLGGTVAPIPPNPTIPEPATLILLGIGLAGLSVRLRR